jgi:cholesterol 7-dehydrogenase
MLGLQMFRRNPERGADEHEIARERTYPPPYPSGWYKVAYARDIRAGRVAHARCCGHSLALFRDGGGAPAAIDARCPHLGADLSAGRVKNGCLECPFHRWCFRGDGVVAEIPYQRTIPPLRARVWPTRELHGMIFVYHHHGKDHCAPPLYQLAPIDEISDGRFAYRGRHDFGVIRTHVLEFAANGADLPHLTTVHGAMRVPWTQVRLPFVQLDYHAKWEIDAAQPHVASAQYDARFRILGKTFSEAAGGTAKVRFVGPGALGILRFILPSVGEILVLQLNTPLGPLRMRSEMIWFAEPRVPRLLILYVVGAWASQFTEDIGIWERKSYLPKPLVVENDGPMSRFRKWYGQFYDAAPGR